MRLSEQACGRWNYGYDITAGQPGGVGGGSHKFTPTLKGAALPGQEEEDPRAWSVEDVGEWLSSLALGQYRESFADAAVDGAFLLDLNDEDLRNTLGIDHALHRKKILNSVRRLAVTVQAARVAEGGVVAAAGRRRPNRPAAGVVEAVALLLLLIL